MSDVAPDGARGSHLAVSINISLLPELRGDASLLNSPAVSLWRRFGSLVFTRTIVENCGEPEVPESVQNRERLPKLRQSRSTPKASPIPM